MGENDKRLMDINDVCFYMSLKPVKCRALMEEIGAKRRIGAKVLYDKETIDRYIDSLKEEQ